MLELLEKKPLTIACPHRHDCDNFRNLGVSNLVGINRGTPALASFAVFVGHTKYVIVSMLPDDARFNLETLLTSC